MAKMRSDPGAHQLTPVHRRWGTHSVEYYLAKKGGNLGFYNSVDTTENHYT